MHDVRSLRWSIVLLLDNPAWGGYHKKYDDSTATYTWRVPRLLAPFVPTGIRAEMGRLCWLSGAIGNRPSPLVLVS